MKDEKKWTKWIYWFTFAVAVIFVYKTLDNYVAISGWIKNLLGILMPFILAILVAYLFYIPCRKFEQWYKKSKFKLINKKARSLSVFTVYLIATILIIVIINVILPTISKSFIELASNLPNYYENAKKFIEGQPDDSILSQINAQEIINRIQDIDLSQIFSIEKVWEYIKSALGIVDILFAAFVTIVVSIYILIERREIMKFIQKLSRALFKEETSNNLGKYFEKTNEIFFKFISSQILDGIIVGIILSIAMSIMGVKYAVLLGFMIGLFNIIPYFGAIIAVIIAIIITMFTGGIAQAVWTAIIIIILQQIDANIINPKIVGNSLRLSQILIIFAVTFGGAYFGILGMFLSVPIIAVLKILLQDYIEYKNHKLDKA